MDVIPYSEWCEFPFARQPNRIPAKQDDVWLHHGASGTSSIRTARAYARYHLSKGWAGIGYSWLIAEGKVLEGRGPGRAGAHTSGHNARSYGICMVGNYSLYPPSAADVDALVWLLQHGHDSGWFTYGKLSGGHRDVGNTTCPGDSLYSMIATINRKVDEGVSEMSTPSQRNIDDDLRRIRISLRALANALNVPVDLNGPTDGTTVIT